MASKLTVSAKKCRKQERNRLYRSQTINIGDAIDQWRELKAELNMYSDRTFAVLLIQAFKNTSLSKKTSTPRSQNFSPKCSLFNASASTVTASTSVDGRSTTETATESETESRRIITSSVDRKVEDSDIKRQSPKKRKIQSDDLKENVVEKRRRRSLPHVRISLDYVSEIIDEDDPTYEPSKLDISFMHDDIHNLTEEDNVDLAEEVHDLEANTEDLEGSVSSSKGKQAIPLKETTTLENIKDKKHLLSSTCLMVLLNKVKLTCDVKGCKRKVTYNTSEHGSAMAVSWKCDAGHDVYMWTSQPLLPQGIFLGNFQALTAVTLSGNNFTKIALFAKFLGLGFPSQRSHSRIQSKYIAPIVEAYWMNLKASLVEEHRAVDVQISGDGRMDSPGYSAKYCTYTVMNQSDKNILAMEIVDKRECQLKSGAMEAEGFKRAVSYLQGQGIIIKEIVTDAHPQISSIMRKDFPEIKHSFDMWHGAKNLGKKLMSIACSKGNETLKPWLSDITNHFFYSADTCDGDVEIMQAKWVSVLNHIVNRHEWTLGACEHEPIEECDRDKEWLTSQSQAYNSLQRVVLEPRLLKSFPYYVTCQATAELESFNNHILMYAPKRSAFSFEAYKCRCYLAAIDYTKHMERDIARDKKGNARYRRKFSKSANNWTSNALKVPKQYSYIPELVMLIVNDYCASYKQNPLRSEVVMSENNPGHIASTIAPVDPPSTAELVESKKPRIKKKDSL